MLWKLLWTAKKAKHPTKKAWLPPQKKSFFFIHSIFSQAEINSKNNSSTTGVDEHALYFCNKSSALKHSFFVHCDAHLYIINVWFPVPLIATTKKIQNCSEKYLFRYKKSKKEKEEEKKKPHTCGKQDFIDFIKMNDVPFKMRQKMTTNKLHLCSLTKQLY